MYKDKLEQAGYYNDNGFYKKQVGPLLLEWMAERVTFIDVFVITPEYNKPIVTISFSNLDKTVEQFEQGILEMCKVLKVDHSLEE